MFKHEPTKNKWIECAEKLYEALDWHARRTTHFEDCMCPTCSAFKMYEELREEE